MLAVLDGPDPQAISYQAHRDQARDALLASVAAIGTEVELSYGIRDMWDRSNALVMAGT